MPNEPDRVRQARLLFERNPSLESVNWNDGRTLKRSDLIKDDEATGDDIANAIIEGLYDTELELILDAAHSRKRELRGVRTIRNLRSKKRP